MNSIYEYVKQASNFHFQRAVNEYLSNKIDSSYTKRLEIVDNVQFDINIEEDVKQYLDNFDEDSFNDDIKIVLTRMRIAYLKLLKKVKVAVKIKGAWMPKTGNTKVMSIYLSLNSDEFYERWILEKNKWRIFGDSRPVIKNYVNKIDLLPIIQRAIENYEK